MDTTDVLERTLEQEKCRYDRFCRLMYIISTVAFLFCAASAVVLLLSVFSVSDLKEGSTGSAIAGAVYGFLVIGGIGLLWNFGRQIFRRLKTAETPFCYDIADKIKGAGTAAVILAVIWEVYRMIAEAIAMNHGNSFSMAGKDNVFTVFSQSFIVSVLLLGFVLIMAAYVFNYGCKLQQESDETL